VKLNSRIVEQQLRDASSHLITCEVCEGATAEGASRTVERLFRDASHLVITCEASRAVEQQLFEPIMCISRERSMVSKADMRISRERSMVSKVDMRISRERSMVS